MLIATEEDEKLDLERAKERFQIISLAAETSMDIVTIGRVIHRRKYIFLEI